MHRDFLLTDSPLHESLNTSTNSQPPYSFTPSTFRER